MKTIAFLLSVLLSIGLMAQAPTSYLGTCKVTTVGQLVSVPILVTSFNDIAAISLSIKYDSTVLKFVNIEDAAGLGLMAGDIGKGVTNIGGNYALSPVSMQTGIMAVLVYKYKGGQTAMQWNTTGVSCEWATNGGNTVLTQTPSNYVNGFIASSVTIGNQNWMKYSLNTGKTINASVAQSDNGIVEKYCYDNKLENCNVYGGLYQWAEAMGYHNGVTNTTHWEPAPPMVQGICPDGWHIPSKAEFATLINYLGGMKVAGGKLKETGKSHWGPLSNIGATNSSEFTALPSGAALNGKFASLKQYGNMWTTTKGTLPRAAWFFGETFAASDIMSGEQNKLAALAVRCIENNSVTDTTFPVVPIDYGSLPLLIAPKITVSGNSFTVPVTVKNFKAITNANIYFDFNPNILSVQSMTVNISHQSMTYQLNPGLANIQFWFYSPMELADNTVLFTITFAKKTVGVSVIAWEPETSWNNVKSPNVNLIDGTIKVE